MIRVLSFFAALFISHSLEAADYTIDYDNSQLTFSGIHAGQNFSGQFESWAAEISFDPDDLANSFIRATFDPKSAKTGNPLYDGTLPQADWFDVSNHSEAIFRSNAWSQNEDGTYRVEGILTIRGIEKAKIFSFRLSDLEQNPVKVSATFQIDRLAYEIGVKSDPKAEWVSQYIDINMDLSATR